MACDYVQLARPGVRSLAPYQPGQSLTEIAAKLGLTTIVKLNSNENPSGPSAQVIAELEANLVNIHRYADDNGTDLKQALADHLQISSDRIVLGNGSNQLLKLIAQAYVAPGDEVIYSQYSFALYPIISQALGSRGVEVKANQWGCDLTAMAQAVNQQTKLIFLANPNNPTGTYCGKASFIRFMGQLPESVLVVLDEAYFDYLEQGRPGADYFTGLSLLDLFPNLIVTRTFSKAYGLAGLHIGYAVANRQIARLLNTVRTPFNVNSLSQIAAKTALADQAHIRQSYQLNLQGKAQLEKCFNQWGLAYIPSVANFISVETGRSAQSVQQALLAQGVVVRDLTSYQMPGHVRVTVGLPDENDRFLQALKRVLNEGEVSS